MTELTPETLGGLANSILRGDAFESIVYAEQLRECKRLWAADRAALAEARMAVASLQALGPGSMIAGKLPREWERAFLQGLNDLYAALAASEKKP